jgi:hypothetical protein
MDERVRVYGRPGGASHAVGWSAATDTVISHAGQNGRAIAAWPCSLLMPAGPRL